MAVLIKEPNGTKVHIYLHKIKYFDIKWALKITVAYVDTQMII